MRVSLDQSVVKEQLSPSEIETGSNVLPNGLGSMSDRLVSKETTGTLPMLASRVLLGLSLEVLGLHTPWKPMTLTRSVAVELSTTEGSLLLRRIRSLRPFEKWGPLDHFVRPASFLRSSLFLIFCMTLW